MKKLILTTLLFSGPLLADLGYVANISSFTVSVFDTETNTVINTVMLVGPTPDEPSISRDGTNVWVPQGTVRRITTIDGTTGTFVSNFDPGTIISTRGVFSADGTKFFLLSSVGGGALLVIDVALQMITNAIPTSNFGGAGVALSPDGNKIYVAGAPVDGVTIIDANTEMVTGTFSLGAGSDPRDVAFSPSGSVAYFCRAGLDSISVVDTSTDSVVNTIAVGDFPWYLAFSPNGNIVYVSNRSSLDVSVINTGTETVTSTIPIGIPPAGIAFSSNDTVYIVRQGAANDVQVRDVATEGVITSFSVGNQPSGIAINVTSPPIPPVTTVAVSAFCNQNVFATQIEFFNVITWEEVSGAVSYKIFRDSSLSILAGTSTTTAFTDHNRQFGSSYSYYIVAVDSMGGETFVGEVLKVPCR